MRVGRSGVGKTRKMLEEIRDDETKKKHIIITPDQLTHRVERELCGICGDDISLRAEVLSFSRLSNHIFHHCGGLDDPELDKGGRVLLLHQSVNKCQDYLEVLSHYSQHSTFYDKLMKTVDELKTNRVDTGLLLELDSSVPEQKKIHDIALICGFYDAFTRGFGENQEKNLAEQMGVTDFKCDLIAFDPRDRLSRVADALSDSSWGEEKTFWVDGFTDFTPQQLDILQHLMGQGDKMTVNLIGDFEFMEEEDSLFAPTFLTLEQLKERAKRENIPEITEEVESRFSLRVAALAHLEKELFLDKPSVYDSDIMNSVHLFSALSPRSEVEWVASEILDLVREGGHRFRDILVVARDFSAYGNHIKSVFSQYEIPFFATEMSNILDKPVISVVKTVFQAINSQFNMETMLAYLKTGFSTLEQNKVDELEEYVLSWEENNWRSPWEKHTKRYDGNISQFRLDEMKENQDPGYDRALKSYESNANTLKRLNLFRFWAMKPLLTLEKAVEKSSGKEQCIALYDFLEEIHLYGKIKERQELLEEEGNLAQSQEYKQLWEVLCSALEQCHQLFTDEIMDFKEFSKVFILVLSQYTVGTIPVSLDQVTAGETTRLKSNRCKTVFWLGCEDSVVPLPANSGGLLNDLDRKVLSKLNITLNQESERLLYRETTTAYEICALAEERLYFSFPSRSMEGESLRPCFLIERIQTLYPGVKLVCEEDLQGIFRLKSPGSALEQTQNFPFVRDLLENHEIWKKSVDSIINVVHGRGKLTSMGIAAIYGDEMTLSATALDRLNSCQFSFFLYYGLRCRGREKREFRGAEYGNMVHHVLEKALKSYINVLGKGNKKEIVKIDVSLLLEKYIEHELGGTQNKSSRELFLLNRMKTYVDDVVTEVTEEMKRSEFTYLGGEVQFHSSLESICGVNSEEMSLFFQGSVDRVDGFVYEDNLYLHLVDYKTGRKTVSYHDILEGRDVQLLLYYLAIKEGDFANSTVFSGQNLSISPAALSYLPGKTESSTGEKTSTAREDSPTGRVNVKHTGMFVNDESLLYSLEEPIENKFRYIPVSLDKDGKFKAVGDSLMKKNELELLLDEVKCQLSETPQKIICGEISANPTFLDDTKNACLYCDFKSACHFNSSEDLLRNVAKLTKTGAISLIKEKGMNNNGIK